MLAQKAIALPDLLIEKILSLYSREDVATRIKTDDSRVANCQDLRGHFLSQT